jgi:quinolinate synthase
MARRFAEQGKRIITLDDTGCLCTTMYRISPHHLAWALENLVEGRVVNRIQVRPSVKRWAKVALDRMLEVQGTGSRERGKTWVNHSRISWCGSGQSK